MAQTIEWKKDKRGWYLVVLENQNPGLLRFNNKMNQQQSLKLLQQFSQYLKEA
jgi:hypothetical protein